jgi:hypothetical protein
MMLLTNPMVLLMRLMVKCPKVAESLHMPILFFIMVQDVATIHHMDHMDPYGPSPHQHLAAQSKPGARTVTWYPISGI